MKSHGSPLLCDGDNRSMVVCKQNRDLVLLQSWYSTDGNQPGHGVTLAVDIARGLAYLHHRQVGSLVPDHA
jgi:hypothetical protein